MPKTIKSPLLITLCLTRTTYDDRINVDHFSITHTKFLFDHLANTCENNQD
jgi:hypothetical protein